MIDPSQFTLIAKQPQRVCDICVRPISKQVDIRRSDSFQSLMVECPVCTISLLGMRKWDAENHLRQCFSEDNPPVPATRYVGKSNIKSRYRN